jgi:hypothetical protein
MSSNLMLESDALKAHLFYKPVTEGRQYASGLILGLRDARFATGRNADSGDIFNSESTGNWLGALGYMAVLDQIGSCFKPKSHQIISDNSMVKALTYFTSLSSSERLVLYALRCAFAHDYSLSNVNTSKIDLTHYFEVTRGSGRLVKLPIVSWSGDYSTLTHDNQTLLDLEEFGNTVEKVYFSLVTLAKSSQLDITLAGGSDELIQRYGFFVG